MSHFKIPDHILIGKKALEEAMPYISECGTKALIVTGKHVGKSPMYEKLVSVLEGLNIQSFTFTDIIGEPTDRMINEGIQAYKDNGCDFVIGIGGGSPLDSAKAIAMGQSVEGHLADYMGKEIECDIPPVIAIPTTAGTGSEVTKFIVITDEATDVKMLLKGDCLIPKIAIIDPAFTVDMPKSVTAATGLDAFTHAIEAYTSRKAFGLTDSLAASAIKRIFKYLPVAYKNGYDTKAREEMAIAATEAGICINNSSVTLVHGMSRPIGALFHVPHGLSNAMLLSECMKFAVDGAYEKFGALAREVQVADLSDSDEVAANKLIAAIDDLCAACEVPTLSKYGIDEEKFMSSLTKMASDAVASGSPGNTIKEVTADDCIEIYKRVYSYK